MPPKTTRESSKTPPEGNFAVPGPATPSDQASRAGDPNAYDASKAVAVEEVLAERGEVREVWRNSDGTFTERLFAQPKYYLSAAEAWEPIDNAVIPDPSQPGSYVNKANSTSVRFTPIGPDGSGGLVVEDDGEVLAFSPKDATITSAIAPRIEGNVVTYPEVWPDVDVVYTVLSNAVKEDIVLRAKQDRSAFEFAVAGNAALAPDSKTPGALRAGSRPDGLAIAPAEVVDAQGAAIRDAKASQSLKPDSSAISVSVDKDWLDSLDRDDYPVRIDPTVTWGPSYLQNFWSGGGGDAINAKAGNPQYAGGVWRSAVQFPASGVINGDAAVQAATLQLQCVACNQYQFQIDAWWATALNFSGAAPHSVPNRYLGATMLGNGTASIDLTSFYQDAALVNDAGRVIGLSGDEWTVVGRRHGGEPHLQLTPAHSPRAHRHLHARHQRQPLLGHQRARIDGPPRFQRRS